MSIVNDRFSLFHMTPWAGLPVLIQPSCHRAFVPLRVLRPRSSVETVSRCSLLLLVLVSLLCLVFQIMTIRPASNTDKVSRLEAVVPDGDLWATCTILGRNMLSYISASEPLPTFEAMLWAVESRISNSKWNLTLWRYWDRLERFRLAYQASIKLPLAVERECILRIIEISVSVQAQVGAMCATKTSKTVWRKVRNTL